MRKRLPLLGMLIALCLHATQDPGYDIKLEIVGQSEITLFGYFVTLSETAHRTEPRFASAESGDTFSFRSVPTGDYTAQIFNAANELVKEEMIHVGGSTVIRVQLPPARMTRPSGGTISFQKLRNPPDKKAVKRFYAALRYSEAGQPEKAAAELLEAVRISPQFSDAYTNLAAANLRMRRYEIALDFTERAMAAGGPNPLDLSNRALAQMALGRYDEAVQSADKALRLDANTAGAHFVLGTLLAGDPKTRAEAIRHLERVRDRIPDAANKLESLRMSMIRQ